MMLIVGMCFQRYDKQEKEKKTKPAIVQLYEVRKKYFILLFVKVGGR